MRDYSKVTGAFWTGKTGRALRGDSQAQVVAMYLLTTKHANMIGVFHCPLVYIAHETGSPIEGASKALRRLSELGFCTFDEETEMVWVHEMAKFQIGDALDPRDKQVKSIQKQYEAIPESRMRQGFYERYKGAFHLVEVSNSSSPFEAPSKPLRSQEQEQESEQEQKQKPPRESVKRIRGASESSDGFDRFWAEWPKGKRVGKADAAKAWGKLKPDATLLTQIIAALQLQRDSTAWRKDGGQFIPNPATWINGRRWEDETEADAAAYTADELEVMAAYNVALGERGWPVAVATPFSPDRAAAIRAFLGFGSRDGWVAAYLGWLGEHLPAKEGYGFDWSIKRDSYLRAKEGNFAALREVV